jgi:hypothetical protein
MISARFSIQTVTHAPFTRRAEATECSLSQRRTTDLLLATARKRTHPTGSATKERSASRVYYQVESCIHKFVRSRRLSLERLKYLSHVSASLPKYRKVKKRENLTGLFGDAWGIAGEGDASEGAGFSRNQKFSCKVLGIFCLPTYRESRAAMR